MEHIEPSRFPLGRVLATPAALAALEHNRQTPISLLARHARGDWGEIDPDDRTVNEEAVMHSLRLLSIYRLSDETSIWIITEADRSATIVLLPDDY